MVIKSLKWRIIVSITGIVAILLAITTLFFEYRAKKELSEVIEHNAFSLLDATKNHVESQYNSILYHKSVMLARRKQELKNNTTIAFAIIDMAYEEFAKGRVSEAKAKQQAIKNLKKLRYDDGVGYFWVNDTGRPYPRMVMHPTIPDLDGNILDNPEFNCALGKEENLFKAFVDVSLETGDGYVDYLWPKPIRKEAVSVGEEQGAIEGKGASEYVWSKPTVDKLSELQSKISYVKRFGPWNWIIGTGVYIDDIEKDVQDRLDAVIKDLNKTLNTQKVGESGYFFIFNENNDMLVHPNIAGTNVRGDINPVSGKYLVDEMKQAAHSPTHKMEYMWDRPGYEGEYRFIKKVYISYYNPLGWYICSSVYKEDLEQRISNLSKTITLFFIVFMIIAILFSLLISKSITNPLNSLIRAISKTDKDGIPIGIIPKTRTSEIKVLSDTMSSMLASITKSGKELIAQRDFSLGIISGAPYIICGLDKDGVTTFINPAGEKATGYSKEEIIGKNWWKLFYVGEQYKQVEGFFVKFTQGDVVDYEMVMTCKNGEFRNIAWSSLSERDGDNVLRIIGFGNDITDKKIAEVELQLKTDELYKANKELTLHKEHLLELVDERTQKLNESLESLKHTQDYLVQTEKMSALGGLVAGVAHEINTPVGIGVTAASHLQGKTERVLQSYKDNSLKRGDLETYLNLAEKSSVMILANMTRAADLIQSFKQVAVDQSSEQMRSFNLKSYIEEILLSVHSELKKTPYIVELECTADLLVNTYPGALSQILTNLLMNSVIHGFDGAGSGTILIKAREAEGNIEMIFKDNGKGISEENLTKIFDPFFTTRRGQGGSGLGMHIVYNLITQTLKGNINCSSVVGQGSVFELHFPIDIDGKKHED